MKYKTVKKKTISGQVVARLIEPRFGKNRIESRRLILPEVNRADLAGFGWFIGINL